MSDRGLGDTIARVTRWLGFRPCSPCEQRRQTLNQWVPFRRARLTVQRAASEPVESRELKVEALSAHSPPAPGSRAAVVAEARAWIGTPYRLGGRVKGAGCDCATLLIGVYQACGLLEDEQFEPFAHDWFHHTTEERYLFRVLRHAEQVAELIASRGDTVEAGNLVLTRAGGSRVFNHGGIVVAWPRVVHAGIAGVEEVDATRHPLWTHRRIVVFDPWRKSVRG